MRMDMMEPIMEHATAYLFFPAWPRRCFSSPMAAAPLDLSCVSDRCVRNTHSHCKRVKRQALQVLL